jgi:hypothetical protein
MECMDQMTEAAAKKDHQLTTLQGELSAKAHQLMLAEQRAGGALTELDEVRRRVGFVFCCVLLCFCPMYRPSD